MMGRHGCRKRHHQVMGRFLFNLCLQKLQLKTQFKVNDPILNEYFEFTGINRELPDAQIGPVWKEKPPTEPTSLWHVGKSMRWNQDNIRDAERLQFRLDTDLLIGNGDN